MTTQTTLLVSFSHGSEYTVKHKGNNTITPKDPKVGITDDLHTGNWVIIKDTELVYKKDGIAGNSEKRENYENLSKEQAINKIDEFLFTHISSD